MGVDIKIYLPHDVCVEDVAQVIGLLAGLEPKKKRVKDWNYNIEYTHVPGVTVKPCMSVPGLNNIIVRAYRGKKLINGEEAVTILYDCEAGPFAGKFGKRLSQRSTPFWVALGVRLAKFFGGKVLYRDCEGIAANRYFPKPRRNNEPRDGKVYAKFHQDKFAVKPITAGDLKRARRVSAYIDEDFNRR